jgi:hypothetical protein
MHRLDTIQSFLYVLGMKSHLHLETIIMFSIYVLNHVIDRPTKIIIYIIYFKLAARLSILKVVSTLHIFILLNKQGGNFFINSVVLCPIHTKNLEWFLA